MHLDQGSIYGYFDSVTDSDIRGQYTGTSTQLPTPISEANIRELRLSCRLRYQRPIYGYFDSTADLDLTGQYRPTYTSTHRCRLRSKGTMGYVQVLHNIFPDTMTTICEIF